MGGLSPDAITHAVPVYQLLVAGLVAVAAVVAATWKLFVVYEGRQEKAQSTFLKSEEFRDTLSSVLSDKLDHWADSRQFRAAVTAVVSEAISGWKEMEDRLHSEHRRAIADLQRKDEARAETITRIHSRIDVLWERVNGREE